MTRNQALLLRAAAVWTVFVWSVFVRNLVGDDEQTTGFKVVHLTLAVVSVAFAVAIWRLATTSRREASERPVHPRPLGPVAAGSDGRPDAGHS